MIESDTPTPRTDEQHAQFPMGGFTLDFARQLERELAEAREGWSLSNEQTERAWKQRDVLAKALRNMILCAENKVIPDAYLYEAKEALKQLPPIE